MWGIARKNLRECENRTQGLERGNLPRRGRARKSTIATIAKPTLYPTDLVFLSTFRAPRSLSPRSAFRFLRVPRFALRVKQSPLTLLRLPCRLGGDAVD